MPTVPFRGLASQGILKDPAPYQLPIGTFSDGSNIRFSGGKASRSPIFRTVYDALPLIPLEGIGFRSDTGTDQLFMLGPGQVCYRMTAGALSNVSPSAYTPSTTQNVLTATILAQVVYFNDSTNVPLYYAPSSALFAALPNWDASWRCKSLRGFGDYLVALNVTKGSNSFGNMVKWSDLALNGLPPGSWDATDSTVSAGENPLEDLRSPLVDGLPLRGANVLYSHDEIWAMEPSSGDLVFTFRRLFGTGGMLSQNCAVEVDGKHYVLGPNDIYVHDGNEKNSLVDEKNRIAVFSNLDTNKPWACRVAHLAPLNSVLFAYPTGSGDSAVPVGNGANKGLVINLSTGSQTFIDLPNIHSVASVSVDGSYSYSTIPLTLTYATVGGSYWGQEAAIDAHTMFLSEALGTSLTASRVLGYDFAQRGALTAALCSEAAYSAFLERRGIDLDDAGAELSISKLIRRVLPQARLYGETPLKIRVGAADNPEGPYRWTSDRVFDPATQYKVDVMASGRYLAVRFTQDAAEDFDVTGFDADVVPNGAA